MSSLTSDELNYLVLRYLLESGFVHSAYTFSHESFVMKSSINASDVPPGALISFVQKGLQYTEIETHVNEDGTEIACDKEFNLLTPHVCEVTARRAMFNPNEPVDGDFGVLETERNEMFTLTSHTGVVVACQWHPTRPILATASADGTVRLWDLSPEARSISKKVVNAGVLAQSEEELDRQTQAIIANSLTLDPNCPDGVATDDAPAKKRKVADGSAVSMNNKDAMVSLAWNLKGNKLAVGCYDGRVLLYNTPNSSTQPHLAHTLTSDVHKAPVSVVRFSRARSDLLASGGVDGTVCVWDMQGKLKVSYAQQETRLSCVLDLDWRDGMVFAAAGIDVGIEAGDEEEEEKDTKDKARNKVEKKEKKEDDASVDSTSLSQTFNSVWLYHAAYSSPLLRLARAHQGDVNSLRWCPQGFVLASSGEDGAVKLWRPVLPTTDAVDDALARMREDGSVAPTDVDDLVNVPSLPVVARPRTHARHLWHTLLGHERGVTCVRFNDVGPCTALTAPTPAQVSLVDGKPHYDLPSPVSGLLLASASLDTTARVWDVQAGACRAVLSRHVHPVTGLAWSGATEGDHGPVPGTLLATYGHERVHVWQAAEAKLIKTMRLDTSVLECSWAGNQLAAGTADGSVVVMDAKL